LTGRLGRQRKSPLERSTRFIGGGVFHIIFITKAFGILHPKELRVRILKLNYSRNKQLERYL